MSKKQSKSLSNITFALAGMLTIQTIQARKDSLLAEMLNASELIVNLSDVESIDVAGVQLLLAIQLFAQQQQKSCQFVEPSDAVKQALCLLGLYDQLLG